MKLFLVAILALVTTFGSISCSPAQTSTKSDTPRYTADQVIDMAVSNLDAGLPGVISWNWVAQYLPAQPDSGLKGVWWIERSGLTPTDDKVTQVWYFHEDTGTFTDAREK